MTKKPMDAVVQAVAQAKADNTLLREVVNKRDKTWELGERPYSTYCAAVGATNLWHSPTHTVHKAAWAAVEEEHAANVKWYVDYANGKDAQLSDEITRNVEAEKKIRDLERLIDRIAWGEN